MRFGSATYLTDRQYSTHLFIGMPPFPGRAHQPMASPGGVCYRHRQGNNTHGRAGRRPLRRHPRRSLSHAAPTHQARARIAALDPSPLGQCRGRHFESAIDAVLEHGKTAADGGRFREWMVELRTISLGCGRWQRHRSTWLPTACWRWSNAPAPGATNFRWWAPASIVGGERRTATIKALLR